MVFVTLTNPPPRGSQMLYLGPVIGFDGPEVIFTDRTGKEHFLANYYSWLHVVCPD